MSKTSQRRRSAYEMGHRDARSKYGIRYYRHPFMRDYLSGFKAGMAKPKRRTFLQWFREVFA